MKFFVILIVFCSLFSAMAEGVVGFRFDDNQSRDRWFRMADVFKKHNVRFSISVNLLNAAEANSKWIEGLRKMEADGFEIMDHTPNHCTQLVRSRKYPELIAKYAKEPYVDHSDKNTLYFKYDFRNTKVLEQYTIDITNGKIITFKGKAPRVCSLIELNGKYYFLNTNRQKPYILKSFWNEDNVNLPDAKEITVKTYSTKLQPFPGVLECLVAVSRDAGKKIGLKTIPRVWIQPGGPYPMYTPEILEAVLGKLGYVSADMYAKGGDKGIMDPFFKRNAYAMSWGNFNLENLDLANAKHRIAETVSCNRVAIGSSHFCAKDGNIDQYIKLHDELLTWLEKKQIKVMTQGNLADYLKQKKFDRNFNILSAALNDLDDDKLPDGFRLDKTCIYDKGIISFSKNPRPFSSDWIYGLPKGNAEFSVEYKGSADLTILLDFNNYRNGMVSCTRIIIKNNAADWTKHVQQLKIPENAQCIRIQVCDNSKDDAATHLKKISLIGK